MYKTLKKMSAFFERVFNCKCKKKRTWRNLKNKRRKSKKMKGG